MECWRHFVLACRIICKHSLTNTDIILADSLLMQFCKRMERIYGESVITPNMHLHGHLKEVILDYGPVQEFWCFSFERYNGILGRQPTNNHMIEPQLMRQFLLDNFSSSFNFPDEFKETFSSLDLDNFERSRISGSLMDTITKNNFLLPARCKQCVFDSCDVDVLAKLYAKIYPEYSNIKVNNVYKKYSSITLRGKVYGSSGNLNSQVQKSNGIVFASWDESLYGSPPTVLPDVASHPCYNERPVNVHYYLTATCTFSTVHEKEHHQSWTLACVSWFSPHPCRHFIDKPAELWFSTMFESFGMHSYMPLDNLLSRCAHGPFIVNDEALLVVVPLV